MVRTFQLGGEEVPRHRNPMTMSRRHELRESCADLRVGTPTMASSLLGFLEFPISWIGIFLELSVWLK